MELMRRFSKALGLVKTLDDEAPSEDFILSREALGGTHLDNAVFLSASEHELLLFLKAAAAHTRE